MGEEKALVKVKQTISLKKENEFKEMTEFEIRVIELLTEIKNAVLEMQVEEHQVEFGIGTTINLSR